MKEKLESRRQDLKPNAFVRSGSIYAMSRKFVMDENLRNHVFTSGEASLSYLGKEHKSQKFYHVGPPRDFDLFQDFKDFKSDQINESEYFLKKICELLKSKKVVKGNGVKKGEILTIEKLESFKLNDIFSIYLIFTYLKFSLLR